MRIIFVHKNSGFAFFSLITQMIQNLKIWDTFDTQSSLKGSVILATVNILLQLS